MTHGFLQILKCFGVGLGTIAVAIAVVVALAYFGKKAEFRLDTWLDKHPRINNTLQVIAVLLLVAIVFVAIVGIGCDILGIKP